ncbi:hypothetical protein [Methanorbis rubei]|uniref:Uncharacterized protein n=1 Tax=Methanorbis rubei TaxID=3028300 RepID=A0AAE4SBK2_9EURY|nr:hypothetical protein [Methanocorpusculaceae archaeon Cs1]
MARKKEEFDPLGGSIGGSGSRKKKSKGKSFDVLGGGFGGEHAVEKESFDTYSDASFGDSTDFLMETGSSSSKSKPKKKGFFSSLFGGSKKQPAKKTVSPETEEIPQSYVPKHVRDPELSIRDGVMETGIVDRMVDPEFGSDAYECEDAEQYIEYDEPRRSPAAPEREEEEDLFEEEDVPRQSVRKPVSRPVSVSVAEPVPVKTVAPPPPPTSTAPAARRQQISSLHTCYLCGASSPTDLPTFGSEHPVPLCRTCYRAVTTLVKFRDPADEREIKTEWFTLCPHLDSDRADNVIEDGRRNS